MLQIDEQTENRDKSCINRKRTESPVFMIGRCCAGGLGPNTMKLTPGWAFQLFYWDYVIGHHCSQPSVGITLGSAGGGELSFFRNIAVRMHLISCFACSADWSSCSPNLLLVAAIDNFAGLAVASPSGLD